MEEKIEELVLTIDHNGNVNVRVITNKNSEYETTSKEIISRSNSIVPLYIPSVFRLTHLRSIVIDASGHNIISGTMYEVQLDMFKNLHNLESVHIEACNIECSTVLPVFPQSLMELSISRCRSNSMSIYDILASLPTTIAEISIHEFSGRTADPVTLSFEYLEELYIGGTNISSTTLLDIIKSAAQLHSISLENMQLNDGAEILSEICKHTELTELMIDNIDLNSSIPDSLYDLTDLQHLTLISCNIVGSIDERLGNLRNLVSINIWGNPGLTIDIDRSMFDLHPNLGSVAIHVSEHEIVSMEY